MLLPFPSYADYVLNKEDRLLVRCQAYASAIKDVEKSKLFKLEYLKLYIRDNAIKLPYTFEYGYQLGGLDMIKKIEGKQAMLRVAKELLYEDCSRFNN